MLSKQCLNQLKSTRAAAIQACKKRKSKASSIFNLIYKIKDNKLNVTDTSDTQGGFEIWSGIKTNGSDSNIKKNKNNNEN